MAVSAIVIDRAMSLFNHQWRLRSIPARLTGEDVDCRLSRLMPDVLRLAQELGDDEPLDAMRPPLCRMVQERDAASRSMVHGDGDLLLEEYVDTLLRVVERVRAEAREQGRWVVRTDSAAPLMCG